MPALFPRSFPELSPPGHRFSRDVANTHAPRETSAPSLRVLVVEDDVTVRQVCAEMAGQLGCQVLTADSVPTAQTLLREGSLDVVFLDWRLPGGSGAELLAEIRARQPRAFVVVMTAYATVNAAVDLLHNGAGDFLSKPFGLDKFTAVLQRARERRSGSENSRALEQELATDTGWGKLIGTSAGMEKIYRIVSKVAFTRHPVLILGESGTGKEWIARAIHGSGPQHVAPFVPVDCGSLAPALLEQELFGAADAAVKRPGLFVAVGEGTLYLEEVAGLQPATQSKLLRAVQDKQVWPLGATSPVPFRARLLASSSRDLQAAVDAGRFRRDLYDRLNVVNIKVPPLRERAGDIPLLAAHFLERQRRDRGVPFRLSDETLQYFSEYHWAGNLRELETAVEHACALSSGPVLHLADLSTQLQAYAHEMRKPAAEPPPPEEKQTDLPTQH